MKNSASVKINDKEVELSLAMIGPDEVIGACMGLISDPSSFLVSWKHGGREGRLIPSERMFPEDGMEFTISKR